MTSEFDELSEIFPPGSQPLRLTRDQLLALIDRIRLAVERDDSMEGTLMYAWSPEPGFYDVGSFVRVGNTEGQGSAIVTWAAG